MQNLFKEISPASRTPGIFELFLLLLPKLNIRRNGKIDDGFGKGEAALQNKKITVEIRSLNSKQLDLGLRLPAVYRQSEYEIRNSSPARSSAARSMSS